VLPALLVTYEYFLKPTHELSGNADVHKSGHSRLNLNCFLLMLRLTFPFWTALAIYFVVRRIVLGTFLGGYDDKLVIDSDYLRFLENWLNSLAMIFVPINLSLLTPRIFYLAAIWICAIMASLLSSLGSLIKRDINSQPLPSVLNFLVCMLLLFLLPVYKLMAITGDLQSSRLAYFASVPVCCLVSLGLFSLPVVRNNLRLAAVTGLAFLSLSAFWLHMNNKAWADCGTASNNMQQAYSAMKAQGVKNCIVFGAPDTRNGAYLCRNAFHEMHAAELHVQSRPSLFVSQSVGAGKDALVRARPDAIYAWNDNLLNIVKCCPVVLARSNPIEYSGYQLKQLFSKENENSFHANGLDIADGKVKDFQLDCNRSSVDVIVLNVTSRTTVSAPFPKIIFYNDFTGPQEVDGQLLPPENAVDGSEKPSDFQNVRLAFALRGLASWQFDGTQHASLLFERAPKTIDRIRSVVLAPVSNFAPSLTANGYDLFQLKDGEDLPGEFRLNLDHPKKTFKFDATHVKAASGVLIQISHAYSPFSHPNAVALVQDETLRSLRSSTLAGSFDLSASDFAESGRYYVRVWATNHAGRVTGLSSDPFTLHVNK
jgi:hypothetical protein